MARLAAISEGAGSILVTGEAGIGKTRVWETLTADARHRGVRVLCARGAERESALAFGGLTDLLSTVPDRELDDLPPPQRTALLAALLRAAGHERGHDRRAVSAGVLSLVRQLSSRTPLLLAVDDLQWLDLPSARVIEYVVRRLTSEPVIFLASRRDDGETAVPLGPDGDGDGDGDGNGDGNGDRVTRLAIGPLDQRSTERLVAEVCAASGRPSTMRRRRLLAELAAGNPLFACELAGSAAEVDTEHLPATLQQLVEDRVRDLPQPTRDLLVVAATMRDPTVPRVAAAVGQGIDETNLRVEEAAEAGVLTPVSETSGIAFRHPVYRAGVYAAATAPMRRSAHRRAASACTDPEEEAGHLALSATHADSALAARLDAAARRALSRGAPETATHLAGQALRLTPPGEAENEYRRSLTAARFAFQAGEIHESRQRLETLLATPAPVSLRARAMLALGELESHQESHTRAMALFAATLALDPPIDIRGQLHAHLAYSAVSGGDFSRAREHAHAGLALVEGIRDPALGATLCAVAAIADYLCGEPVDEDLARRAQLGEDLDEPSMTALRPSLILGHLRMYEGRLGEAVDSLSRLRSATLASGDESGLVVVSAALAWAHCWRGELPVACRRADEAVTAAAGLESSVGRCIAASYGAVPYAFRGQLERAGELAAEGLALADRTGLGTGRLWASWALLVAALQSGQPTRAAPVAERLLALVDEQGLPTPVRVMALADALEVLVELGQPERAERYVSVLRESAVRTGTTWARMQAERCAALCRAAAGDLDHAALRIGEALRFVGTHELAVESGRTLLVAGQVARRRRQRRQARAHIERAVEIFSTAGATTWAGIARTELARTSPPRGEDSRLTAMEERVARLAVDGLTNRAMAARLNISPKTVEANLARVYRKFGIHSRAQLGATLTLPDIPGQDAPPP